MQTDIPLKRLTLLRAADLLPLFGLPFATLLGVDSLELPASAARLDNILRVRSPGGQTYAHVVEWQGYRDLAALWRFAGYLAWVGQRAQGEVVVGTMVYLTPEADVGDGLTQIIDGQTVSHWPVHCLRLWQQDARSALAAGSLGLAVLSPLMRGAYRGLVEEAAERVLREAPRPEQADLLSILGVFAAPVMGAAAFTRMIGKERLMESPLIEYLLGEKLAEERQKYEAERQAERQKYEAELAAREQAARRESAVETLQLSLEEVVVSRFPQAPAILLHDLRRVDQPEQLQALIAAAASAPDPTRLAEQLQAITAAGENGPRP